jgi:hypothetical protein
MLEEATRRRNRVFSLLNVRTKWDKPRVVVPFFGLWLPPWASRITSIGVGGIFDRYSGEFSTGIDSIAGSRKVADSKPAILIRLFSPDAGWTEGKFGRACTPKASRKRKKKPNY